MATQIGFFDTIQMENLYTPSKNHSQHQQPGSTSKVRVIIRVRPFLPHEISSKNSNPISCISLLNSESVPSGDEVTVHLKDPETSRNECYKLDAFFGQEDKNVSEIFQREVSPLIPGIFEGYNATVFAYGATGSGKTYTMQGSDELPGLMSLSMSNILSTCERTGSTVSISYYEVYLDRCYDLLELKEQEFLVWEDKDGHVHLKGLAQVEVNSMSSFHEIFSCALQRRKVARTGLNDVSSRSHGVLVITISTPSRDSVGKMITGKLNLIDLAGNEDNRRTCNDGIRLQESAKINLSLFALSNVIYALNNGMSRIPYRESKLTRILQDSLGGTNRALMVACLNPGEYQESVHTVSLAARSRHISNSVSSAQKNTTPMVKVDMEAKLRAWLESKGKTKSAKIKSAQRIVGLRSPFNGRTPSSVNSTMKLSANLDAKLVSSQSISNCKQRIPCVEGGNLFNNGGYVDPSMQAQDLAVAETVKDKSEAPSEGDALESDTFSVVNDEEMKTINSLNSIHLSPVSEKITGLRSPQREVLSPINSNLDKTHLVSSDPKTPKPHFTPLNVENKFQGECTPLDKFSSRSSNLKSSLAQEYIEFLNAASREELLQLKGIGQKIASYIIEQREISPLKSLNDLEKIGLTSKQVHNMFGRAARGVFE
ncbi:kinesin KIN-10B [Olea europaea subsp. europaea]|uniref:Kinesin-like protein n=1 Tax=Olea europaea subsp. europaea TaxID=158383 RepID=A0A8S0R7G2_OLEEU|nr:kinesin KIN-10B [Olea europaea subsp. europaea]